MKTIHWMVAVAGIALGLPAQAEAATTDPEIVIYRFPGVRDDGSASNVGVATAFHCTNFSGVQENVRFVTRATNGDLLNNNLFIINHLSTVTLSTHLTAAYNDGTLGTGVVSQGTTAIAATSTNVICTAIGAR
jgi:hypothetical protein